MTCPGICRAHPTTNREIPHQSNGRQNIPSSIIGNGAMIIGIPSAWVNRFSGVLMALCVPRDPTLFNFDFQTCCVL